MMVVLSRRAGEAIIAGDITVIVLGIRGDMVRLGVTGPPEVGVFRKEVHDAIGGNEPREHQDAVEPEGGQK